MTDGPTLTAVVARLAAFAKATAAEWVRSPAKPWRRRDRAIQYSRGGCDWIRSRGVLDHPLSRV